MSTAPVRHPGFLIFALTLLGGYYLASVKDPVKSGALEQIEATYVAERADCLALKGRARWDCDEMADQKQQLTQQKLVEILSDAGHAQADVAATSKQ